MGTKDSVQVEVIVTVSGNRRADTKDISERLQSRGLTVSSVLEHTGMIVGHSSEAALESLKQESGVAAVEAAGTVQVAPPDSKVQ